jgi:hypothetical protein
MILFVNVFLNFFFKGVIIWYKSENNFDYFVFRLFFNKCFCFQNKKQKQMERKV